MNVVGYIRLSQEDKNKVGTSLENQEKAIIEFCEKYNHNLVKIYNEGYWTSKDWERPKFNAMLDLVGEKVFDVVLIRTLDRFTRDPSMFEKIELLKAHNVKLLDTHGKDWTDDLVMTAIMLGVSSQKTVQGNNAQREMMLLKAKEGMMFGLPPFGFKVKKIVVEDNGSDKIKKKWVIVQKDMEYVKQIFELYANTNENTMSLGRKFGMTNARVSGILKNKKYIGIFEYTKREKVKGKIVKVENLSFEMKQFPKMIDEALFEKVQSKIFKRNNNVKKVIDE